MKVEIIPMHLQNAVGQQRALNGFSRQELSLCLDVLARIIHSNPSIEILRPGEHELSLEEIRAFREAEYKATVPYLVTLSQQEIEENLAIDERSLHFIAMHEGHIAGTLRVTSPPYEFSHLSPEMADLASQFKGYMETSRLVVGSKMRGPFVGEKLMFGAVRWLCVNTDAQGFLFVCKDRRRHYFENYGFHAVRENPFRISERANRLYYLMTMTYPEMIDRFFSAIYLNLGELEKRYRWTHNVD